MQFFPAIFHVSQIYAALLRVIQIWTSPESSWGFCIQMLWRVLMGCLILSVFFKIIQNLPHCMKCRFPSVTLIGRKIIQNIFILISAPQYAVVLSLEFCYNNLMRNKCVICVLYHVWKFDYFQIVLSVLTSWWIFIFSAFYISDKISYLRTLWTLWNRKEQCSISIIKQ